MSGCGRSGRLRDGHGPARQHCDHGEYDCEGFCPNLAQHEISSGSASLVQTTQSRSSSTAPAPDLPARRKNSVSVTWHTAHAELQAAIFDMGGVLTTPIFEAFLAFERKLGLPEHSLVRLFRERMEGDEEPDFFQLERGLITEAEYYKRLAAQIKASLGIDVSFPDDPSAVRLDLWGNVRKNEEMLETVRAIAPHYKVGMLTNNVKEWTEWRDAYPVEIFDVIVDSCEVGMRKPDPEIYHLTCKQLGVEPNEAAFVDDIPANVEAAADLGLHAILFTHTAEVIDRLRPLFPKAFMSHPAAILEE
ncbi:MAG: HAD family phosphatase [Actinobacteria bacterium]|nr:HAD family phosphatase [Actinomycetota bacterium]